MIHQEQAYASHRRQATAPEATPDRTPVVISSRCSATRAVDAGSATAGEEKNIMGDDSSPFWFQNNGVDAFLNYNARGAIW